jgi:thiol-disulfide isomerase/thioredoxin
LARPIPRRGRPRSGLWLTAIVLVGVAAGILAFVPLTDGTAPRGGPLVGQPAPALEATDLDGRRWTLDANTNGRLVWINFWATSCPPCRTEMPAMQRLAEEHPDDLLILGVDWGEARDSVEDFVARYAIDYPILLDPGLENYYRWSARDGLPRHYFVRDGIVVREVIGELPPAEMLSLLDELLG